LNGKQPGLAVYSEGSKGQLLDIALDIALPVVAGLEPFDAGKR